jgi:hypothetical protein
MADMLKTNPGCGNCVMGCVSAGQSSDLLQCILGCVSTPPGAACDMPTMMAVVQAATSSTSGSGANGLSAIMAAKVFLLV